MAKEERVSHTFEPVWNEKSEILILGTFPSVKSRENQFYYGHQQNRFWKVIAGVTGSDVPQTIEDKKEMLLNNHIAIWDVIASCNITGSSDASIKDVVPNDISAVLDKSNIGHIYANGAKAYELYMKYIYPQNRHEIYKLPSTSPANAVYTLDKLLAAWKIIVEEKS